MAARGFPTYALIPKRTSKQGLSYTAAKLATFRTVCFAGVASALQSSQTILKSFFNFFFLLTNKKEKRPTW